MSRKFYEYTPDYAVCPGETIRGAIEALGMTQKDFAARLGCSERHLIALLDGKAAIVQRMAAKLEKATGTPARVWMNLETNYRQTLLRLDEPHETGEPEEAIAVVYIPVSKVTAARRKGLDLAAIIENAIDEQLVTQ